MGERDLTQDARSTTVLYVGARHDGIGADPFDFFNVTHM